MTLTEQVAKNIIKKLLKGEDYRIEIVTLINADFLQYAIDFLKKIVEAKLNNQDINIDWYKKEFLSKSLPKDEIAIHSGLNQKTIKNMYNSETREIVIDASYQHYEQLYEAIKSLVDSENEFNLKLTIKIKAVSVELNIGESLIVINTLAVKRAALRGGYWSTAGKRVEKPLMQTLCKLYGVSHSNYLLKLKSKKKKVKFDFEREIDFYLVDDSRNYKCEVKLMGIGNPESADAVIARASEVFIADKLSETNINQLNSLNVNWVELRRENGYKRFRTVLESLNIPFNKDGDYTEDSLKHIFDEVFQTTS